MASRDRETRAIDLRRIRRVAGGPRIPATIATVLLRGSQALATVQFGAGQVASPGMIVHAAEGGRWRIATLAPVSIQEHRRGIRALVLDPLDGQDRVLRRGENVDLVRE